MSRDNQYDRQVVQETKTCRISSPYYRHRRLLLNLPQNQTEGEERRKGERIIFCWLTWIKKMMKNGYVANGPVITTDLSILFLFTRRSPILGHSHSQKATTVFLLSTTDEAVVFARNGACLYQCSRFSLICTPNTSLCIAITIFTQLQIE